MYNEHMLNRIIRLPFALTLLASIPTAAIAGKVTYVTQDALVIGRGYDAIRGQGMGSRPFNSLTVLRESQNTPSKELVVRQGIDILTVRSSSSLDSNIEGRYLAYSGSLGLSSLRLNETTKADFVFQMNYDADYGLYSLKSLNLTSESQALIASGLSEFIRRNGTHAVIGEKRHSYVTATYSVRQLSSRAINALNMSLSASGSWIVGSLDIAANYRYILETLAKSESIEVRVKTNAATSNFSEIISDPSDVKKVLTKFDDLVRQTETAIPVAYESIVQPWNELFTIKGTPPVIDSDTNYKIQMDEYYKLKVIESRLQGIVDERLGYYNYLSVANLDYYQSRLTLVQSRIDEIVERLTAWGAGQKSYSMRFEPIVVTWIVPKMDIVYWFAPHTVQILWVNLYGGSRFWSARLRNKVTGRVVNGQLWNNRYMVDFVTKKTNKKDGVAYIQFRSEGAEVYFAWQDFVVEVLNEQNEVVFTSPIPKPD